METYFFTSLYFVIRLNKDHNSVSSEIPREHAKRKILQKL